MVDPTSRRGIGASVLRREDPRFLTGAGRYTDDIAPAGVLHGAFVRSPHAHATVGTIDRDVVTSMPGVRVVLTGRDLEALGLSPIPSLTRTPPYRLLNLDGTEMPLASQFPLALDKARYVGEPVALVVAETPTEARDAAEALPVEYDELPAAIDPNAAEVPGAARVWDDLDGNCSYEYAAGNEGAVEAAFARAERVVAVEVENQRLAPVFLEPRSIVAAFDAESGRYVVEAGSQSAHRIQELLAMVLGIDRSEIRVITPDVGGGFGSRNVFYPEFAALAVAARRLGTPVKWTADRGEAFLTDAQGRDVRMRGELALDGDGRFLALKVDARWRHGAYFPSRILWVLTAQLAPMICGPYTIGASSFRLRGTFSNTVPIGAYRGVARAEATYLLERLVDAAAAQIGADPIALRRLNLIPLECMPFTTASGAVYESAALEAHLDRALALVDHAGFEARRAASAAAGRARGLGVSLFIESAGGVLPEYARVRAFGDGSVEVAVGTQNFGMGHETTFAQIASDALGVDFDRIRVVCGDTDAVAEGAGSFGSRSIQVGGSAAVRAVEALIERARERAAALMQCAPDAIEYADGTFRVADTGRAVDLFEVARGTEANGEALEVESRFAPEGTCYPNGCHVCEVEVDLETGRVEIVDHAFSADVGRLINPMIVEGQLHGGIAQGIGQAVLERVVYEPESGQPITGSLMDYALPRADDLPALRIALESMPSDLNPLGVKGAGESPTTGSPPAVVNAVLDALRPLGVHTIEMPMTPFVVWEAIRAARRAGR